MLTYSFENTGSDSLYEYLYKCIKNDILKGNLIPGYKLPSKRSFAKNLGISTITIENAYEESAPHKICAYIYELANAFNGFYHDTKILAEENDKLQKSYIALLVLTKEVLETCIDMLGFSAPDRM